VVPLTRLHRRSIASLERHIVRVRGGAIGGGGGGGAICVHSGGGLLRRRHAAPLSLDPTLSCKEGIGNLLQIGLALYGHREELEKRRLACDVREERLDGLGLHRRRLRHHRSRLLLPPLAPRDRLAALGHALETAVPVVLDRVVGAPGEELGDLSPFVAELGLLRDQHVVLLLRPRVLPDRRVQLVVPPLAALLAITTGQVLGDLGPAIGAVDAALLGHEPPHRVVFLLRPRPLQGANQHTGSTNNHQVRVRWGGVGGGIRRTFFAISSSDTVGSTDSIVASSTGAATSASISPPCRSARSELLRASLEKV
jgi:hypothetical protein